jgi:hypothetical protein
MKLFVPMAWVALLAAPLAHAAQVPLQLEGEGPWYRLAVPLSVQMAAGHADLRDLRVLDKEGNELAYALTQGRLQTEAPTREAVVKWFPLRGTLDTQAVPAIRVQRSDNGTLVEVAAPAAGQGGQVLRGWLLDASAFAGPLHRLRLDWRAQEDGFQRFSIEASDDLQHWQSWGEGQVARLAFDGEQVEQRDVSLPGASARYLRLLWQAPQQAPALLDARVASLGGQTQSAALAWSAPLPATSSAAGEYTWTLPLALPLERLQLTLPPGNVLAPVSLASRNASNAQWQPLASGLLYRLPQDGKETVQDEIALPGVPLRQLRLRVDPRGNGLGSDTPRIRVAVAETEVVFLARGSAPYALRVGDATAQSAALPLGTLIPGYSPARLASLGRATLDSAVSDAMAPAAEAVAPGTGWQRIGLWAVLLAGVALLGGMAFSLLRKPSDSAR